MRYSESKHQASFNWRRFISKEAHTENERKKALTHAKSWVNCAIGNLDKELPRDELGSPKDLTLLRLGCLFLRKIELLQEKTVYTNFMQAELRDILNKIEERSMYLLSLNK